MTASSQAEGRACRLAWLTVSELQLGSLSELIDFDLDDVLQQDVGLLDSTPVSVDCERLHVLLMHLRHMDTKYHVATMTLVMSGFVLRPGWQGQRSCRIWSCLVLSAVSKFTA